MRKGYECCCLYLIDSTKLTEQKSLLTNLLVSQCVYLNMGIPFVLVATKTDLVQREEIEALLEDHDIAEDFYQQVQLLCANSGYGNFVYLR